MHTLVDTGNRLDESGDTTFAFSNDQQRAVRLRQRDRDRVMKALPGRKLAKQLLLLAACVYLLTRDYLTDIESLMLDNEYDGHQGDIKRHLLNLIHSRLDPNFDGSKIQIRSIGRKNKAHDLAWKTYRGKLPPDKTIQAQEILDLLTS